MPPLLCPMPPRLEQHFCPHHAWYMPRPCAFRPQLHCVLPARVATSRSWLVLQLLLSALMLCSWSLALVLVLVLALALVFVFFLLRAIVSQTSPVPLRHVLPCLWFSGMLGSIASRTGGLCRGGRTASDHLSISFETREETRPSCPCTGSFSLAALSPPGRFADWVSDET